MGLMKANSRKVRWCKFLAVGHRDMGHYFTIVASNKKLVGAPGIATRSKDATRGSWPYY